MSTNAEHHQLPALHARIAELEKTVGLLGVEIVRRDDRIDELENKISEFLDEVAADDGATGDDGYDELERRDEAPAPRIVINVF
ncbi:hypothetical protein [Methylocystis sp. S23]